MIADRALGIYVHWPYCARLCPYCDFNIYKDRGGDEALVDAIVADIGTHAERMDKRPAMSLHFGGGTPSLMKPQDVERIRRAVEDAFGFERDAEIGFEANPDGFEPERARAFADVGVNRLSLGVQSFDAAALRALGRTHDPDQALAAIEMALAVFPRVSVDLIYARAEQTIADWRRELALAVSTGVGHLSPYQLTIEDGTAFALAYRRGRLPLPAEALAADFYEATQEELEKAGLSAYEISNHARTLADQSRHNLLYWRSHDWVGVGPGAHGRIAIGGSRHATEAHRTPKEYITAVQSTGVGWSLSNALSPEDVRAEAILMGVRIAEGLPTAHLNLRDDVMSALVEDGLAEAVAGSPDARLRLTLRGRLLADRIGEELAS